MHWNPGAIHLPYKLENMKSVINGYKPHILGISESNVFCQTPAQSNPNPKLKLGWVDFVIPPEQQQ